MIVVRPTNRNFVLDAGHPGHSAHVRLGEGPLVRPVDDPLQSNPAAVHFRGYPMTRDRDIPMKRIRDFGANIQHGAPSLLIECHVDGSSGRNFYQDVPERCDALTQWVRPLLPPRSALIPRSFG